MPLRPELTNASVPLLDEVDVVDELGRTRTVHIPGERPLTVYLDKRELVTLMTLGAAPEPLVLGYLRNQRLIGSIEDIASVPVSYTHLTLPTNTVTCRSRWSPYH